MEAETDAEFCARARLELLAIHAGCVSAANDVVDRLAHDHRSMTRGKVWWLALLYAAAQDNAARALELASTLGPPPAADTKGTAMDETKNEGLELVINGVGEAFPVRAPGAAGEPWSCPRPGGGADIVAEDLEALTDGFVFAAGRAGAGVATLRRGGKVVEVLTWMAPPAPEVLQ